MKKPIQYFQDGRSAAMNGLGPDACPLLYQAWPRDCWMVGNAFGNSYDAVNLHTEEKLERVAKTPAEQGAVAFMKGLGADANPYGPDSFDYRQWSHGWRLEANIEADRLRDSSVDRLRKGGEAALATAAGIFGVIVGALLAAALNLSF